MFEFELELVDEHFGFLLVCLWRGRGLKLLFYDALEELLRLELDNGLYPEQRLADIRRLIVRAIGQHVPIRDAIAKKVEVSSVSEVADVHSGPKVQMRVQLEYLVHSSRDKWMMYLSL